MKTLQDLADEGYKGFYIAKPFVFTMVLVVGFLVYFTNPTLVISA